MTRDKDAAGLLRSSAIPLWRQLATALRQQIDGGLLKAGSRLPAEPELCALYGVSRITVRAAIERLLADELVVRKQGKGTFVAGRVVRQELSELVGIIPNLRAQGIRVQTALVGFAHEPAPAKVAAALGIAEEPVLHFRRLYRLDDMPFGLCETWIPEAAGVTREQAEDAPCYVILSRHLGRAVARADLVIKVRPPDRDVGRLIGTGRNETLLCLERVSFTAAGGKCERTCFWVRPDQYEFAISVDGPMPIASGLARAPERAATIRTGAASPMARRPHRPAR